MADEQIKFLRELRDERWSRQSLRPLREHINYLLKFFKKEKKIILFTLALIFGQGILEIILILISHQYIKSGAISTTKVSLIVTLLVIAGAASLYLVVSYLAIKLEKTAVIRLINNLRENWFKSLLSQTNDEYNLEKKGRLLAKISYHLPMLSSGLTNCLLGSVRWLLLVFIFIILCFIFGPKLLWWLILSLILSALVMISAFFIAKKYVIKETTFYSQVIKLVDFSLSDWQFTKFFRRENQALSDFNNLVKLDSYFRVRRDLWLKFGSSILFIIFIFFSWLISYYRQEISAILSVSPDNNFLLIILIIYCSRLLFESLRVGLYSVPLLFGLILSIPPKGIRPLNKLIKHKFKSLIFQSSKTKLYKKSKYYKNLSFEFIVGFRYLISGDRLSGKTKLAKLFAGRSDFNRHAWIIKADKQRFYYNDFFRAYSGSYYIDPAFKSGRSILEIVAGKEKDRVKTDDLLSISNLVNSHKELKDIFFERADWRLRADKFITNSKSCLLLQVAHCLQTKPKFITIDNYWLDLNDPAIDALLLLLEKELKDSSLVFFSKGRRDLLNYNNYYEI
ncbi:MAG: ABC transporter transmembrane domain-containing protein [Patescibacteria group bacterium]